MNKLRHAGFKLQIVVSLTILVGLFFVEYPPIFLVGYWSWDGLVHKVLTGVLIGVNLIITQYAVRKLGYFRSRADG